MIYLIKFVYSFVLPPGIFVLLLLGMVVWLWRSSRRPAIVLLAVTLLLYLSMTSAVSDMLIGSLERKYPQPAAAEGDVIVILGGGGHLRHPGSGRAGQYVRSGGEPAAGGRAAVPRDRPADHFLRGTGIRRQRQ
ncbi:hypothetical protein ACFSQ7_22430 [Paenibacillus rhizoplanae]